MAHNLKINLNFYIIFDIIEMYFIMRGDKIMANKKEETKKKSVKKVETVKETKAEEKPAKKNKKKAGKK